MNKLLIFRNIVGKLACFAYFGFSSVFASFIIFPLIRMLVWKKKKQRDAKIAVVRAHFSFFIGLLFLFARYKIDVTALQNYKALRSTVIVANHPSLIDIIVLIAAVPHPDCIVAGRFFDNFWVQRIVGQLFVNSFADTEQVLEHCKKSLHAGNNMIIFPEGTRTRAETISKPLKRGAAQIALRACADILPIHIKTENLVGLGKYESLFKVHERGYIQLTLEPHALIKISAFSHAPFSQAARTLTEIIKNAIFLEDGCEYERRYPKRD